MGSEMSLDQTPSSDWREVEEKAMAKTRGKTLTMPPLPTYDVSLVLPVIDKMKRQLAALEETINRENGPLLKSTVEKALTQLAGTKYEEVLEGITALRRLLSQRYIHSYATILASEADRIIHLIAMQLANYGSMYSDQDQNASPWYPGLLYDELGETLQRFIGSPVPLGKQITTETLKELVFVILPHLNRPKKDNDILSGCIWRVLYHRGCLSFETRDKVLTILLRHYRCLLEQSPKKNDNDSPDVGHHLPMIADFLVNFAANLRFHSYGSADRRDSKHLDTVLFELYKLFDLFFLDIKVMETLSPDMDLEPLEALHGLAFDALKRLSCYRHIHASLVDDMWEPVPLAIWNEAFALIDCELKQLGRSKEEVPFYMWLAEQKIKCAVDESEKKANDDKCSLQSSAENFASNVGDDSASEFVVVEPVASQTSTPETLNSNSEKSTTEETIADDDENLVSEDKDEVEELLDAVRDCRLGKPLKDLLASSETIVQQVEQMRTQMLQSEEKLSKVMAKMVAGRKN